MYRSNNSQLRNTDDSKETTHYLRDANNSKQFECQIIEMFFDLKCDPSYEANEKIKNNNESSYGMRKESHLKAYSLHYHLYNSMKTVTLFHFCY